MCVCVCVPVRTHVRSIKGVRSTGKVNFIPFRPSCHMNLQMKIGMIAFQPFWLVNPPPPNVPLPEIRSFKGKPTFDKPLKRPSFWGCMLRGWLTNHETSSCKMDIAGFLPTCWITKAFLFIMWAQCFILANLSKPSLPNFTASNGTGPKNKALLLVY